MNYSDIWGDIKVFYEVYEVYLKIAISITVIILTILLKQFFVKVVIRLLRKLTQKTKTELDDQLLNVFEKPAKFMFLAIGICIAVKILPFAPALEVKAESFMNDVTRTFIMFSLFWAGYRAADVLASFVSHIVEKSGSEVDDMLSSFIGNGIKIVVILIGGITILQIWIADIAGLLTGLGLGGLAFALAAQDTASNLFGGVTIMMDRPFTIGDWIKTPQVEGTVEEIGFRSTRVRTFGQALVTIPNSTMSKEPITNWSRMGKRRISFKLGVTYSTTNEQMKKCIENLREMLRNHPGIHQETVFVFFERFAESSLDIFIYVFTKTTVWGEFLEVQEDVNLKIMDILKELDIQVAFPSRSIYMEAKDKKEDDINSLEQHNENKSV